MERSGSGVGAPSALCELLRLAREGRGSDDANEATGEGKGEGEGQWVSVHEGWLLKQSQLLKRWRPRYVQLQVLPLPPPSPQPRRLVYLTAPPPHPHKGVVELCVWSEVGEGQEGGLGFTLTTGTQSLHLRPQANAGQCSGSESGSGSREWIEAIAAAITLARREKALLEGGRGPLCWRLLCGGDSEAKLQAIHNLGLQGAPTQPHTPTLTIKVLEARGLMGKDRSGLQSSPYVTLTLGGVAVKSVVVPRSLCPQWHETWVLQQCLLPYTRHAPIEVWDWGGGGKGHFLGLLVLPLLTLPLHRWVEGWHVLGKRSARSRVQGQVRLALHLSSTDTHASCLDHTALCALREVQRLPELNLPLLPFPSTPSHSPQSPPLKVVCMPLVEWEVLEDEASHTLLQLPIYAGQVRVWGRLVLSNYRLVFTSHASRHTPQGEVPWLCTQVALRNIVAVSKKKLKLPQPTPQGGEGLLVLRGVTLRCRDAQQVTFLFPPLPTPPSPTPTGGVRGSQPPTPPSHRRGSSGGLSSSSGRGSKGGGLKALTGLASFLNKPRPPTPSEVCVPLETATPVALVSSAPSRRRTASGSSLPLPADEATLWTLEDQEDASPSKPPSPSLTLVLDLPSPPHSSNDTLDDEEGGEGGGGEGGAGAHGGGLVQRLVYRTLNPTPDTDMLLPPPPHNNTQGGGGGGSSGDAFYALLAADYRRMGVPDERWKLSTLNHHFEVCGSYPSLLCVPSSISEDFLHAAASCRSKARLPVLTYRHKATMATLCRSSQPLVGLKLLHKGSSGQWGSQCEDDVVLLEHMHAASGPPPTGPPPPPAVLRRRHSEDLRRLRSSEGTAVIEALSHEALLPDPHTQPPPSALHPQTHTHTQPPPPLGSATAHARSRSAALHHVSVPLKSVPLEPQPQEQARAHPASLHTHGYLGIDGRRREKLVVLDCRPELNAVANAALHGMGFENTPQYKQVCQVVFLDIANIHVMRKSLDTLQALCFAKEVGSSGFWGGVEGSGWLLHVHKLLTGANVVARLLHYHGVSLLLHCSDGWDRTTQVCGLAQLLLDPYYRTLTGFRALVTKEWVAFGHKFAQRAGHPHTLLPPSMGPIAPQPLQDPTAPSSAAASGASRWGWLSPERSPIFHQWLDAVYQMCRQCPSAFEFSEELLLFLSEHATSGWFGDFLLDCEQDRVLLGVRERSVSIWEAVQGQRHRFVNPDYRPEVWGEGGEGAGGVLPVVGSAKAMCLWEGYFFRHQRHAYNLAWRVGSELDPIGSLGQQHAQQRGGGAGEATRRWASVVDGLYSTDPDAISQLQLLPPPPPPQRPFPFPFPYDHSYRSGASASRGASTGNGNANVSSSSSSTLHRSSSTHRKATMAATAEVPQPNDDLGS